MTHLVLGGSKSGKSRYAEKLAIETKGSGRVIYLATLSVKTPEEEKIVRRHLAQREGKGFVTVERERDILSAFLADEFLEDSVLLEDLTNLYANEMFGDYPSNSSGKVAEEIVELGRRVKNLIVVSNNIFCDEADYGVETRKYIEEMGKIHRRLASEFDNVTEMVCGIEVSIKRK